MIDKRIIFLRSVCVLAFVACLAMATFAGLQRHNRTAEKINQQATHLSGTRLAKQQQEHLEELGHRQNMIDAQEQKIQQLKDLLSFAVNQDYTDFEFNTLKVTATAYTARKEECNSEPWITASGTPSRVGVIAISRDLERVGVNLGDFVIVKGMGLFRVEDRMNKRWEKRIDILHANLEAARRFSKRKVEILWFDDTKVARQEETQSEPLG